MVTKMTSRWDGRMAKISSRQTKILKLHYAFSTTTYLIILNCISLICRCSLAGIAGSNPAGGMDVCLLWIECCNVEVSAKGRSFVQESYRDRDRDRQRGERESMCVWSDATITIYTYNEQVEPRLRKTNNFAWWQFRRMPPKLYGVNDISILLYSTKTRSKVIFKPRCQHYAQINADELILRKWI